MGTSFVFHHIFQSFEKRALKVDVCVDCNDTYCTRAQVVLKIDRQNKIYKPAISLDSCRPYGLWAPFFRSYRRAKFCNGVCISVLGRKTGH